MVKVMMSISLEATNSDGRCWIVESIEMVDVRYSVRVYYY